MGVGGVLGRGVYTLAEAARYSRVHPSTMRSWFGNASVFMEDYAPRSGDRAISFLDLIDAAVASKLREYISMQKLRRVYSKLRQDWGKPHPFALNLIQTDGKTVFVETLGKLGEIELVDVLADQKVFARLVLPFLKELEYGPVYAARWHIDDGVELDPEINFGKPITGDRGISTTVLAAAFTANKDQPDVVAEWYGCSVTDVLNAVHFEDSLRFE